MTDVQMDEGIEDDQQIQTLLNRGGFERSGDYDPAYPSGSDGRWSVDVTTLALLLITSEQNQRNMRIVLVLRDCLIKAGVKEALVDRMIMDLEVP